MADRRVLTRRQARELLKEATRQGTPTPQEGLTLEDLEAAASEVGLDGDALREAAARMERRSGLKLGLLFIGLGAAAIAAALLVLPTRMARGWRHNKLSVHNEQRQESAVLEVWAPLPARDSSRCGEVPRRRVAAANYCLAQRVHLEPRQRARLEIPRRPTACPQIWVRVHDRSGATREALFTLPAAVEIDRHGRLDQKGMGHPHMHPPPDGSPSPLACPKTKKLGGKS